MPKNKAIVFIQKDKFEYFDETQSKIFQFVFQPNLIQDLEIVDTDQIKTVVKSFVETNKIQPATLLFICADLIIFEKTFPLTPAVNKDLEIQKFLENIPFEHVDYKVIDGQKDYQVLAINEDIYNVLKFSFESLGFKALAIIPQSSLGEAFRNSQSLNSDIIKYILSHFDALQKERFIQEEIKPAVQTTEEQELTGDIQQPSSTNQNPINKYKLPILVSVFVVLIGVFSFFIYIRYAQKSKASPVPSTIVAPPIETPAPIIEEPPPSTPSASPTQ